MTTSAQGKDEQGRTFALVWPRVWSEAGVSVAIAVHAVDGAVHVQRGHGAQSIQPGGRLMLRTMRHRQKEPRTDVHDVITQKKG